MSGLNEKPILASSAVDDVIVFASRELVVACFAINEVALIHPIYRVGVAAAGDGVLAVIAANAIAAIAAGDRVFVARSFDQGVSGLAFVADDQARLSVFSPVEVGGVKVG